MSILVTIIVLFSDADKDVQPPTTELWTLHFIAQHFCYLQQWEKALEFINRALEHTPTLVELYVVKGKIYKVLRC